MGKVAITESLLDDLADAISAKTGEPTPLTIAEMTQAVEDMTTPTLQSSKAYTVSASGSTTISPDNGYDAMEAVALTTPAGTITAPSTITGSSATVSTSSNTLTLSKTVSVTPSVTTAGYVTAGTAGNATVTLSATATINPTLTASGATVTAPAGYYTTDATKSVSTMTLPTAASATSSGTSKATISRSTSDQYINIPTGYNSTASYYKINATPNGSVTVPSTISATNPILTTSRVGTNQFQLTLTESGISATPVVSTPGYISEGTAGTVTVNAKITVNGYPGQNIYTSTTDQTLAADSWIFGTQTIKAVTVSGLDASKILSGTTIKVGDANDDDRIASVSGNVTFATYYTGSSAPSSSLGTNGDIYLQTS